MSPLVATKVQIDDALGSCCALGASLFPGNLVDAKWVRHWAWKGNNSRLSKELE